MIFHFNFADFLVRKKHEFYTNLEDLDFQFNTIDRSRLYMLNYLITYCEGRIKDFSRWGRGGGNFTQSVRKQILPYPWFWMTFCAWGQNYPTFFKRSLLKKYLTTPSAPSPDFAPVTRWIKIKKNLIAFQILHF